MDLLCAGIDTALVGSNTDLQIRCLKSNVLFPVFKNSYNKQIQKIVPASVVLSGYNETGTRLVVVTATGLMAFFCFDVEKGHCFTHDGNTLTVIYKTMRILSSQDRILPMRIALEDQYAYNAKTCPFSKDAIILVPFDIVLGNYAAIVRVQIPGRSSCLVRVVFDALDVDLDNLPTRQAFQSPDWQFVYDQGILHMSLHKNVLCILTHVAMVECWLSDHNPFPLLTPLPKDRVNLKLTYSLYQTFADMYRSYVQSPIKWIHGPSENTHGPSENTHDTIPPEWEVNFSTRSSKRLSVQQMISKRELLQPKLPHPLSECWTIDVEQCAEEIRASLVFSDTHSNVGCPWKQLVPFADGIYLLTIDALYVYSTHDDWKAVMDQTTQMSIYATEIVVTSDLVYVVVPEKPHWQAYTHSGQHLSMPPLLSSVKILAAFENNELHSFVTSDGNCSWSYNP